MDGKFTITLTLQKEDHSLQIHSDDSPGLMWSIAAIRQCIGTICSIHIVCAFKMLTQPDNSIRLILHCDPYSHEVSWHTSQDVNTHWSDAIFQQALEYLNNEQRFLFAVIKQKEMQDQSRFHGMITDIRRH